MEEVQGLADSATVDREWKVRGGCKNATDQGLLTHATMKAALNFIREQGGKKTLLCVPAPCRSAWPALAPGLLAAGAPRSEANKTGVELTLP